MNPPLGKNMDSSILPVYPVKNPFGHSSPRFYSTTISCLITCSALGTVGNTKAGGHAPHKESANSCMEDKICMYTETHRCVHTHALKIIHHNIDMSGKFMILMVGG